MGFDLLKVDEVTPAGEGEQEVIDGVEEGLMFVLREGVWRVDGLLDEVEAGKAVSEDCV